MRKIGVLTADKMGGLSQSFCLQRMREARLDSTIVMSRYFSNSARSDFKVSGADSLLRILDRFQDDDVLLFSRLSKAYLPMARDAEMRHLDDGEARRFGLHLHPVSEPMTRKAAQAALDGASISFTVGGFKAVMGASEPVDVPAPDDGFEDAAPPRPLVGILLSGKLSEQTIGRCVNEFRQSGIDDVVVFDPNGRKPGCARTLQELAARIEAVRRSEDSNDEAPKGFDDRVVLCVTEAERVSDACASITVRRGRFQLFGRDGESKTVPAFRFNPSEIQAYGSFAAYAGDLLKAVKFTLSRSFPDVNGVSGPPDSNSNPYPTLTVVFLTHNRTSVATHCLSALCRNLKYGGRIHFCICDDRSEPGHVEALEKAVLDAGMSDYAVKRTTAESWGLGASMNNGLSEAFSLSPLALTTEDDFLLVKPFDVTPHVQVVMENDVAGIRLAHVNVSKGKSGTTCTSVTRSDRDGYWQVSGGNKPSLGEHYTFNNQVMLRHRRIYDLLGKYRENVRAETMETDMCRRYSISCDDGRGDKYKVLYPVTLPLDTLENGLFEHVGVSTMNHPHRIPGKYAWINNQKRDSELRSHALGNALVDARVAKTERNPGKIRFHVITPFYNCSNLLSRCLACVAAQTIDKSAIAMTVVDDASDAVESEKARSLCAEYGFVTYVRSDDRVNTGGAKNMGIRRDVDCDYIVFLDADDTFCDNSCLARLDAELRGKKDPDVMLCGFLFGDSGNRRMFTARSPEEMAEASCIAPWIRVAKKEKTGLFNEKRRIASDVTHYLRQLDMVATVASSSFPLVKYTKDNPNSAWASGKVNFSKDVMASRFMLMSDMLGEKFAHIYTRKAALRQMKYEYSVSLKDVMSHVDESTFA